jgi:hypothetical protein
VIDLQDAITEQSRPVPMSIAGLRPPDSVSFAISLQNARIADERAPISRPKAAALF